MTCETYKKLIDKFLDGLIEADELSTLHKHLATCSSCQNEYENVERVQELLQETFVPQTNSARMRERIVSELPQYSEKPEPGAVKLSGYSRLMLPMAACFMKDMLK